MAVTLAVINFHWQLQHLRAWYKGLLPSMFPMQPTMNVARLLNPKHDFEILT